MSNEHIINIVVECPHCKFPVIIEQLNCRIFRHAIFKNTGNQIDPHTNKQLCDEYIEKNLIYGCGNPFKVIDNVNAKNNDDKFIAIICDYI